MIIGHKNPSDSHNYHDENHDEIKFYLGNSDRSTWWHSTLEQRTPKNQSDWLYGYGVLLTNVQCHRYLYPYHDIENTGTYNWKHTWNHTNYVFIPNSLLILRRHHSKWRARPLLWSWGAIRSRKYKVFTKCHRHDKILMIIAKAVSALFAMLAGQVNWGKRLFVAASGHAGIIWIETIEKLQFALGFADNTTGKV